MSTDITAPKSLEEQQRDFVRWQIVGKNITADEFEYFMQVAQHLGLDPLRRQIYCIKRGDRATIQTGIDGYRLIATRTGELAGIDDAVFDTDLLHDAERPGWARVTVYRLVQGHRCPFTATARWSEYKPASNPMWEKMPFLMLAKCAEALALRKAFPAELSGVYTDAEMDQADRQERPPWWAPEGMTWQGWCHSLAHQANILDKNEYLKHLAQATGKPTSENYTPADYQQAAAYFYRLAYPDQEATPPVE